MYQGPNSKIFKNNTRIQLWLNTFKEPTAARSLQRILGLMATSNFRLILEEKAERGKVRVFREKNHYKTLP